MGINTLIILFTLGLILFAILVTIVLRTCQKVWPKVVVIALSIPFAVVNYVAFSELLSRPKPLIHEWLMGDVLEATLVAAVLDEKGKAIYVWLAIPGVKEPRAYVLPWSRKRAKQIQKAQRDAGKDGRRVKVRNPFELSLDESDPMFYPEPHIAPPSKPVPSPSMLRDGT